MINIYVGNLPYSTTEQDLAELFAAYGEIGSTTIIVDRETGRSKGYGFVQVLDDAMGHKAIEALHGSPFNGRPLTVNEARNSRSRTSSDGQGSGAGSAAVGGDGDASAGYRRSRGGSGGARRHDGHGSRHDGPAAELSRGYSNNARQPAGDE